MPVQVGPLFQMDPVTYHPDFDLFEFFLPPGFEPSHPSSVVQSIGNIHKQPGQKIPIEFAFGKPAPFHFPSLKFHCLELIGDFIDGFAQPRVWHGAAVVEAMRKQHFVAPPFPCHWLSPAR